MKTCERAKLQYMVGGLLYSPAINVALAEKIVRGFFPCLTSVAFCLEDSIRDEALEEAESELYRTIKAISEQNMASDQLPLIFIRVRSPEHMERVHSLLDSFYDVITGYILPKFDLSNCEAYKRLIDKINIGREAPIYIMPILESKMIADIKNRTDTLVKIKACLDRMQNYVLNVRVGGNDFSNLYGLRRGVNQNIYQIGVIRDILVDIINVFAADYVVSGPVWEYFGSDASAPWATGLREELSLDRLNGFIGKTSIHPSQLPLIYESLKVKRSDYEDALSILGWNTSPLGVKKSADGSRMNEVKCHRKWAQRIATLGDIYGIQEEVIFDDAFSALEAIV